MVNLMEGFKESIVEEVLQLSGAASPCRQRRSARMLYTKLRDTGLEKNIREKTRDRRAHWKPIGLSEEGTII